MNKLPSSLKHTCSSVELPLHHRRDRGVVALGLSDILNTRGRAGRVGDFNAISKYYACFGMASGDRKERKLTRTSRLVVTVDRIAADVEVVPGLVQGAASAVNGGLEASIDLGKSVFDLLQVVGLGAGRDTGVGEGLFGCIVMVRRLPVMHGWSCACERTW